MNLSSNISMIKNKVFIIGFVSGAAISLLLAYIFLVKYPPLFTDHAKLSYSIGQQMGQNPRVQRFDLSTFVFSASMRDAKNEYSRLSPEELSETRELMMKMAMEGRDARRGARHEMIDTQDADGFFTSPRGAKFKMLSASKKDIKSMRELMGTAQRSHQFEFTLGVKDATDKEIHSSTKKLKLERPEIPRELYEVLSLLGKNEKLQVKMTDQGLEETSKLLSQKLDASSVVIVERLSVEPPRDRMDRRRR